VASDVVSAGTSGTASSLGCSLETGAAVVAWPGLRGRLSRGEGDLGLVKDVDA
jgi:hypothetical protein